MDKINVGDQFGMLTVLKDLGFFKKDGAKTKRHWYLCECSCEDKTVKMIEGYSLTSGVTKSCGCVSRKCLELGRQKHKFNEFCVWNNVAFVKFTNCEEYFICDLDDLEYIITRTWYKDKYGYAVSDNQSDRCRLNRFIMKPNDDQYVDHISGYINDYRKSNLRNVSPQESSYNIGIRSDNTSGHKGVHLNKKGKYEAYISYNRHKIHLGLFEEYDEAVKAREEAELKYHKEYRRAA